MTIKKIISSFYFLIFCVSSYAQEQNYTVKLFLLDDCVICQSYTPLINNLYDEYNEDFKFVGYFPNFRSKKDGIESFRNKYNIAFDLKTDYFKKETNQYGVKVTPEVIVKDNMSGDVIYQGRIDDEFLSIGRRRRVVKSNDLSNALNSIKNQTPIINSKTEAIGCYINFDTFN